MKQLEYFNLTTSFTTKKGRNRDTKSISSAAVRLYCAVLFLSFYAIRTPCFASFLSNRCFNFRVVL
ncbi:hypothetical protein Peur_059533 [Populus x canadensis]